MNVAEIMTQPVISVTPQTTIAEAARLMLQHRVSGLPVTIFIDRDGAVRRVIAGQVNYTIFDRFARVALGEQGVPGVDDPLPLRFVSPLPPEGASAPGTKEDGQ